jgi:hypothetical protein
VGIPSIGPSNDNVASPRLVKRPSFETEEWVSTRRRLKIENQFVTEGSIGRIVTVRSPGRLYDVRFPSAEAIVMTLSHCDIARCLTRAH